MIHRIDLAKHRSTRAPRNVGEKAGDALLKFDHTRKAPRCQSKRRAAKGASMKKSSERVSAKELH